MDEKSRPTWTKQDVRYLRPHVLGVAKEEAERKKWDTLVIERK
jgi:ubiquinol-cytochrome c reductase subunit 7